MPSVSVILPFYNAAATLERALNSIRNQDFADYECILVDNNSTDGSGALAKSLTEDDDRFQMIAEGRQGVAHAFQSGFERSRGMYIARMDADDRMRPERVKVQHAFLEVHRDYQAVGGLVEYRGYHSQRGGFRRYVDWNNSVRSYIQILNNRFIDSPVVNPTAMWRRETGEDLGMYRCGEFPEDYEMWLRWLGEGVKMAKVEQVVLDWYDSPHRLTRNHPAYSDEAFYRVKSFYLAQWLRENNPCHPEVAVWGAGRISRLRALRLETHGIHIIRYIDIRKDRQLDKPVLFYQDIPGPGEMFILVYIRQWDAKEQILDFLEGKGYVEGKNFLMVS